VLIALLSIGFIAMVDVALAVPNVATSVGLGDVMPFIVPGAAVQPPRRRCPHRPCRPPSPTRSLQSPQPVGAENYVTVADQRVRGWPV
jgi:hypothetical protein